VFTKLLQITKKRERFLELSIKFVLFHSIKEDDKFVAKVIAQRFELNDKYISIIGEIVSN
jgi:hypothetical protein